MAAPVVTEYMNKDDAHLSHTEIEIAADRYRLGTRKIGEQRKEYVLRAAASFKLELRRLYEIALCPEVAPDSYHLLNTALDSFCEACGHLPSEELDDYLESLGSFESAVRKRLLLGKGKADGSWEPLKAIDPNVINDILNGKGTTQM